MQRRQQRWICSHDMTQAPRRHSGPTNTSTPPPPPHLCALRRRARARELLPQLLHLRLRGAQVALQAGHLLLLLRQLDRQRRARLLGAARALRAKTIGCGREAQCWARNVGSPAPRAPAPCGPRPACKDQRVRVSKHTVPGKERQLLAAFLSAVTYRHTYTHPRAREPSPARPPPGAPSLPTAPRGSCPAWCAGSSPPAPNCTHLNEWVVEEKCRLITSCTHARGTHARTRAGHACMRVRVLGRRLGVGANRAPVQPAAGRVPRAADNALPAVCCCSGRSC